MTTSTRTIHRRPAAVESFRNMVLKAELATYISEKLSIDATYFGFPYFGEKYRNSHGDPLLEVLNMSLKSAWTPTRIRLLQSLLRHGYKPNWGGYISKILGMDEKPGTDGLTHPSEIADFEIITSAFQ